MADSEKTAAATDPAMLPENQHTHPHRLHAASAQPEHEAVYTIGTSTDPSNVPTQSHPGHHQHHLAHGEDDTVKSTSTPPEYTDNEKGHTPGILSSHEASQESYSTSWKHGPLGPVYRHRKLIFTVFTFCLFTGWWIATVIVHRKDKNWVIPFLFWLFIMFRLITLWIPARYFVMPIKFAWKHTAVRIYDVVPEKFRSLAGGAVTIAVIIVGSFVTEESADNTRENRAVSLFGMAVIIFAFWATSCHRKAINWRTVSGGMLAQYIIGLFVLRTQVGYDIFKFIADRAADFLGFAKDGVAFLTDADTASLPMFFFSVIPAVIFFISVVQVLYYIGFLQWFIVKIASFVFWALEVSGVEAVVAAATPFIGQGESAMLVRPFVGHMTKAEIHQIMTCGFATISGSTLIGYIDLGLNRQALVSSCIMSIPASLAISKLRYPETDDTLTAGKVVIPEDDESKADNILHAFANGAYLGVKIAGTIVATLLCLLALVGLVNGLLTWWGKYIDITNPELTLQAILSYVLYPVAFLLGVPRDASLLKVAKLISEKIITNEYSAFTMLATDKEYANISPRTQLIATYALCGFGNISSLGIQIGILGQLAPSRGGDVSRLAFSALISGIMATLTSANVAGLVISDQITL